MADVQKENGHLDIANDLAEAFSRQVISPDEWRIIWVVIRKTYGWNKRQDWVSLSQFSLSTGMRKSHVCRAIKKLVIRNIITKTGNGITQIGNAQGHNYSLQKDFDLWKSLPKQVKALPKQVTTITQTGNLPLPKQGPTNTTITKDTLTNTSFVPDKPKRPAKKTVPPDPSKKNGWACWIDANREVGRKDPIAIGKDLKAAKMLLEAVGDQNTLTDIMVAYLRDQDQFIAKQGWPLALLPGRIERYRNVAAAPGDEPWSDEELARVQKDVDEVEAEIARRKAEVGG